ncbi:SDR family NAD(P)-dependent oxidoreductase [Sphingobium aquiterrae]|uniref:SDR family NAD(P)-dependent oxidoreductase n=1 Tax=Sphingobium aquiterrae TaxID=2038656 RepID=UPI0030174F19
MADATWVEIDKGELCVGNDLSGAVALVTGGAAGIGAAIAGGLAKQGAKVAVVDVQAPAPGADVASWVADVRDSSAVARVCTEVAAALGPISILVNNVGGCGEGRCEGIEDVSDDVWNLVLDLNLGSTMRFCRALVPGMRALGTGRIINIGSSLMHGLFGGVGTAPALLPYVTAKSGIAGLTKQLSYDLGPAGITVNAIVPGLTLPGPEAKITKRFNALPPEEQARLTTGIARGRLGSGDDMVHAALFLASPAAGYISGQLISVTGGP